MSFQVCLYKIQNRQTLTIHCRSKEGEIGGVTEFHLNQMICVNKKWFKFEVVQGINQLNRRAKDEH